MKCKLISFFYILLLCVPCTLVSMDCVYQPIFNPAMTVEEKIVHVSAMDPYFFQNEIDLMFPYEIPDELHELVTRATLENFSDRDDLHDNITFLARKKRINFNFVDKETQHMLLGSLVAQAIKTNNPRVKTRISVLLASNASPYAKGPSKLSALEIAQQNIFSLECPYANKILKLIQSYIGTIKIGPPEK